MAADRSTDREMSYETTASLAGSESDLLSSSSRPDTAGSSTGHPGSDPDALLPLDPLWTVHHDLLLLSLIVTHRPVGPHKHFRILTIQHAMERGLPRLINLPPDACRVSVASIWDRLRELYDLDALEKIDTCPDEWPASGTTTPVSGMSPVPSDAIHLTPSGDPLSPTSASISRRSSARLRATTTPPSLPSLASDADLPTWDPAEPFSVPLDWLPTSCLPSTSPMLSPRLMPGGAAASSSSSSLSGSGSSSGRRGQVPVKRKRGRPKGSGIQRKRAAVSDASGSERDSEADQGQGSSEDADDDDAMHVVESDVAPATSSADDSGPDDHDPPRRKPPGAARRGRPPALPAAATGPKKRRGRPPRAPRSPTPVSSGSGSGSGSEGDGGDDHGDDVPSYDAGVLGGIVDVQDDRVQAEAGPVGRRTRRRAGGASAESSAPSTAPVSPTTRVLSPPAMGGSADATGVLKRLRSPSPAGVPAARVGKSGAGTAAGRRASVSGLGDGRDGSSSPPPVADGRRKSKRSKQAEVESVLSKRRSSMRKS